MSTMNSILRFFTVGALGVALSAFGCECAPANPPDVTPVGQVSAVPVDGGFEIRLSALERPVRSLQVDVKIEGALATAASAIGGSDIVEADLGDGSGKDEFTVVVADTRRLNLPAGGVVFVATGLDLGPVTLSKALAVDDAGQLRSVNVVVP